MRRRRAPSRGRTPLRRAVAVVSLSVLAVVVGCSDDGVLSGDGATATSDPAVAPTVETSPSTTTGRVPNKVGEGDDTGGGADGDGHAEGGIPTTTAAPQPPGAEEVDLRVPRTTPNVAQPDDTLLDGEHVGFMVDVGVGTRTVVVDVVQWFRRDDFPTAIAEGRLSATDPCVELDFCIVNDQDRVRTMPVAVGARVSIVGYDPCCASQRTDDLDDVFVRMREGRDLFLLTVQDGAVVALDEVYLP